MLTETLKSLFKRDLNKLKAEIDAYKSEASLWQTDKDISNSAGNLCLHLIGNLNWFIGAQLGNSGYIRERELEFSSKDIPKVELLSEIEKTEAIIQETLDNITADQLESDFPITMFQENPSTYFFLVHLSTHLAYHLGQINYHRRLLDC